MPRTAPDWRLTALLSTLRGKEGSIAMERRERASCGAAAHPAGCAPADIAPTPGMDETPCQASACADTRPAADTQEASGLPTTACGPAESWASRWVLALDSGRPTCYLVCVSSHPEDTFAQQAPVHGPCRKTRGPAHVFHRVRQAQLKGHVLTRSDVCAHGLFSFSRTMPPHATTPQDWPIGPGQGPTQTHGLARLRRPEPGPSIPAVAPRQY